MQKDSFAMAISYRTNNCIIAKWTTVPYTVEGCEDVIILGGRVCACVCARAVLPTTQEYPSGTNHARQKAPRTKHQPRFLFTIRDLQSARTRGIE
jgi:hypothetical protein